MSYHVTTSKIYIKDGNAKYLVAWVKQGDSGFFCVDRFGWGDFNVYSTKEDALRAYVNRK